MGKSNKAYNFFQLVIGVAGIAGCILYGRAEQLAGNDFKINPLIESYNYRRHRAVSKTQTLSVTEREFGGEFGNETYFSSGIITDKYEYDSYPVIIADLEGGENKGENINDIPGNQTIADNQNGNEADNSGKDDDKIITTLAYSIVDYRKHNIYEYKTLLNDYYIVDPSTSTTEELFNSKKLLEMDMTVKNDSTNPQILIYHTHGSESYIDSRKGVTEDTVVGMGETLAKELRSYGYNVLHDVTTYDFVDGKDNRNYAYTNARPAIAATLEKYESIEVVIDLHRDSGSKRVKEINGVATAQVMLFNGLCRNARSEIAGLSNEYLKENLAFSLQTKIVGNEMYPGFMFKIYLKNNRYNMHLAEKCMLVELGTNNNTVEEARNGVILFAEVLDRVLKNK